MTGTNVPAPDKVIQYGVSSTNSALFLYGDPSSSKMALLCAGFADDHTVFQPFAKALSEQGVFCGVMCLPGFDDREDAPWTSHNPNGYTFDEMVQCLREAAKLLREMSTHESAEFTAIFHDWAILIANIWCQRLEEEAEGAAAPDPIQPDKLVLFDVLGKPSPKATNIPTENLEEPTIREFLARRIYIYIMSLGFLVQRYVSRKLAPVVIIPLFLLLVVLGLVPSYKFDGESIEPLYGENKPGIQRMMYMAYPYWGLIRHNGNLFAANLFAGNLFAHHLDWKAMPIFYLYGTKKITMFHDQDILKMLQNEEAEGRSLTRVVAVEEAGHYLYVQKQDECLKHVLEYMRTEKK